MLSFDVLCLATASGDGRRHRSWGVAGVKQAYGVRHRRGGNGSVDFTGERRERLAVILICRGYDEVMCSHYQAEKRRKLIEKRFGTALPPDYEPGPSSHIYPTYTAPIIRRPHERDSGDEAVPSFEVVEAHFGLLPAFAKEVKYGVRTYNARSETVASLASFKHAWAQARHCIVPCEAIYEPDWRSGQHIPTRFTAADGGTLGVAGIWSPWQTSEGKWVDSFAMLTVNADDHKLMRHMHRPDPKRPPEMQDKRMVVILPDGLFEAWLDAPAANSMDFMRQYPAERLLATPEPIEGKANRVELAPPTQADLF